MSRELFKTKLKPFGWVLFCWVVLYSMVLRFLLINTLTFTSFIFSQENRRDFDTELDYQSEAINNVRKEIEETRRRIKSENKKIIFGSLKDHKAGVADYVGEILGYATLEDEAIWAACKENGVNPPRLTKEYLIDKLNLINGLAEKALEMLGTMEGGEKIC